MGAKPGSLDSYPGGGAGTGVTDISPSDTSDVDGINLKEKKNNQSFFIIFLFIYHIVI